MTNYLKQGKEHFEHKEYSMAMEYFQAVIQDNPSCSEAYLFLSDCYFIMGRAQQAQATLYSLLAQDPNNREAQRRLNNIQTTETEQSASSQTYLSFSQAGQSLTTLNTSPRHNKLQSAIAKNKSARNKKWDWSTGNIISGVIGLILFPLFVLGIFGFLPIDGEPIDYSFEWTILSLFLLLAIFSTCMILSPRMKPSWKIKNVIFMIFGLIIAPLCLGLSIDDFEHNGQDLIFVAIGIAFVFSPFIDVD